MDYLTTEDAFRLIQQVRQASVAANAPVAVSIVDQGGNLLAFLRLDGALLASIEVSQVKARTALYFGTDTKNLPFDKPFTPALLGAVSYPLAFVPGGVPLRRAGILVGAIGVGGGTGEQDHAFAHDAAQTF